MDAQRVGEQRGRRLRLREMLFAESEAMNSLHRERSNLTVFRHVRTEVQATLCVDDAVRIDVEARIKSSQGTWFDFPDEASVPVLLVQRETCLLQGPEVAADRARGDSLFGGERVHTDAEPRPR